ncbi:hypothetical protein V0242_24565 (plasmid) [Aeromonas hydrophila]|uniref:hypothetical protein n=1 Tax=Aeromonas hydrophila TaxID=644 RepID=UPI002ED1EE36|nr:hypothetical protein V0242_24565 [Aeromonas hydrophila]
MTTRNIDEKVRLYHGTRSTFDIPDGNHACGVQGPCVWFTTSPAIAQHYIGHQAQTRMMVFNADCPHAMHDPITFHQIGGSPSNPDLMQICMSHGYVFTVPESRKADYSTPLICSREGRLATVTDHDIIQILTTHYGYDFSPERDLYCYFRDGKVIRPDEARRGMLIESRPLETLNLYDARQGDSFEYDYNNAQLFSHARTKGYDGVVIGDRVHSDDLGHLDHAGYAIFPHALSKLSYATYPTQCPQFERYDQLIDYDNAVTRQPTLQHLDRLLPPSAPNIDVNTLVTAELGMFENTPNCRVNFGLNSEALALTNQGLIELGPKFFNLDQETRRHVLVHELCHFISDSLGHELSFNMSDVGCFGPKSSDGTLQGPNGTFKPDECLTESLSIYLQEPAALQRMYPKAFEYVDSLLRFGTLSHQQSREITTFRTAFEHQRQLKSDEVLAAMNTLMAHNQEGSTAQPRIYQALQQILSDGEVDNTTRQLVQSLSMPEAVQPSSGYLHRARP